MSKPSVDRTIAPVSQSQVADALTRCGHDDIAEASGQCVERRLDRPDCDEVNQTRQPPGIRL